MVSSTSFSNTINTSTTAFDIHADTNLTPSEEKKSSNPSTKTVNVTLLLSGGHEYSLVTAPESSSLRQLFALLLEAPEKRAKRLFQLPIHTHQNTEEAALCFTGDRLVGIVTDPPVYLQQPASTSSTPSPETESMPGAARSEAIAIPLTTTNTTTTTNTPPSSASRYRVIASPQREQALATGVIPSRYIQLTQFLDPATHQRLLDYTHQQQHQFVGSSTSTGDANYRQSLVLHHFPEFSNMMQREIHAAFADVTAALHIDPFNITQVEAQLTAHNDGNFYKIHNDNGSPDTATRVLTYVYYFYQEPKPFTDGELRIYDSCIENNFYVQASSFQDITPLNNSIVFFPSHYMHEVLPIICPSQQFFHSRFTINGWVRR